MGETTEKFVFDVKEAIASAKRMVEALKPLQRAIVKVGWSTIKAVNWIVRGFGRATKAVGRFFKRAWKGGAKFAHRFNSIKAAIGTVTGALGDMGSAMFEAAKQGESLRVAQGTFEAIGGTAKDLADLKSATKGLVPEAELVKAANLGEGFKIATEDMKVMAQIAVGASALTGESVEFMMQSITAGTARGSKMILDNLGVMVRSAGVIEKEFAKKIGKSVDKLTESEKKHALVMEIKNKSSKQLAAAELVRGNNAQRTQVQITDFTDKMKVLIANGLESSGALDNMGAAIESAGSFFEDNADTIGQVMGDALGAVSDGFGIVMDNIKPLLPILQLVIPLFRAINGIAQALAPVFHILAGIIGGLLRIAVLAIVGALSVLIEAMRATAEAVGVQSDALDNAAKSMDSAIDSALGYEKASTKAAEAQAKLTEKSKEALAAMKAQAGFEIPPSVEKSYAAVIQEISDLAVETDRARKLQEHHFESVMDGGQDLVAMINIMGDSTRDNESLLLESLERTGLDMADKITILATIESRAIAAARAVGDQGITAATSLADAAAAEEAIVARVNRIQTQIEKREAAKKKKKKGAPKAAAAARKRGEELAEAERTAGLMLLSEVDRERVELEEEFDVLIAALEGKNDKLAIGLVQARTKALEEFEKTQVEAKRAKFAEKVEGIAGVGDKIGASFRAAADEISDPFVEAFDKVQERAEQNQQFMETSLQSIGQSASSLFLSFINQSGNFRDQVFQTLGGLFTQLGTAFISWATAEGALLSGNPFAAIGAAIALQTVGGLISSIGTRKPSSGGGAGASSAARRAFEDRRNREERDPQVINMNYGFSARDEITRGVSVASRRGEALRGSRSGRRRGRAAA